MHHFFVKQTNIYENHVIIDGEDYNHAVNVLRIGAGEQILVSDEEGTDYLCAASEANVTEKTLMADILERKSENHELPSEIWLFQGLPKSDKLELIIQKAVELGAAHIVPVATKNSIVKLDPKKAEQKQKRWQSIAESAAKQSKRSRIPVVENVVNMAEAMKMCERFEVKLIPYEDERGMIGTCESIVNFIPGRRIAVFIGPEGGFDPMEVSMAKRHGIVPVSLGKRILRTETAAIVILSLIMIRLEIASEIGFETEE